jgi:hypothetical protein
LLFTGGGKHHSNAIAQLLYAVEHILAVARETRQHDLVF